MLSLLASSKFSPCPAPAEVEDEDELEYDYDCRTKARYEEESSRKTVLDRLYLLPLTPVPESENPYVRNLVRLSDRRVLCISVSLAGTSSE